MPTIANKLLFQIECVPQPASKPESQPETSETADPDSDAAPQQAQAINPPLTPATIAQTTDQGPNLETLLRIDPATGETPVRNLQWHEYFIVDSSMFDGEEMGRIDRRNASFGVYTIDGEWLGRYQSAVASTAHNTSNHIVDANGVVIGYYNDYELYGQNGKQVAKIRGKEILTLTGAPLGYFYQSKVYDREGAIVGTLPGGDGKVFKEKQIVANTTGDWRQTLNEKFFPGRFATVPIDFSNKGIESLARIVDKFQPTTTVGKAFRQKLANQLARVTKIRADIKRHPEQFSDDPLERLVRIGRFTENPHASFEKTVRYVFASTKHAHVAVRGAAVRALGTVKSKHPVAPQGLLQSLRDKEASVQLVALAALGDDKAAKPYIFQSLFATDNYPYWKEAVQQLDRTDPSFREKLIETVENEALPVKERVRAVKCLYILLISP